MRNLIIIALFTVTTFTSSLAQINVVPYAGINATKMYEPFLGYQKGGNFGIIGLDIELRKKPATHQNIYATMTIGVSYLKNGFYQSDNFGFGTFLYTASVTDRQMEYIQFPVTVRLNWQPFPLVEDWRLFFGAGLTNSMLMSARLSEKYTSVFISSDLLAPPVTRHYEDSRDVTDLGKKSSLFTRIELGMIYKRTQVSVRFSKSITNLYYEGIEQTWQIPADDSEYLQANSEDGGIFEKYTEVVIGLRIFN
ncbi:MAG TPA: hypothetical protein VIS49_01185 [Cyclobacteriaceae bacterium]